VHRSPLAQRDAIAENERRRQKARDDYSKLPPLTALTRDYRDVAVLYKHEVAARGRETVAAVAMRETLQELLTEIAGTKQPEPAPRRTSGPQPIHVGRDERVERVFQPCDITTRGTSP